MNSGFSPYQVLTGHNPSTGFSALISSFVPPSPSYSLLRYSRTFGDKLNVASVLLLEVAAADDDNKITA